MVLKIFIELSTLPVSSTFLKRGIEKIAHQIATDRKDQSIASTSEDNPNHAGFKYIKTLMRNSNPPPK